MTTPLTVAEARAILIADEAMGLSYETRVTSGRTLGIDEIDAWARLVVSAQKREAEYTGEALYSNRKLNQK